MSKVLLINGSPNEFGCTYTALREVMGTLNANGVDTELLYLGSEGVADCRDCGACHKTGRCIINDEVNQVAGRIDSYDGLIVGSPVYYSGASGQICSFLDRLFVVCGRKMACKPAACVVSCRRGGATAAFQRLNMYFSIANMPIVTSQYWNQVHGNTPEEVMQDEEGLQTMRVLAQNMAWMLNCVKNGGEKPEYEKRVSTNFIR